MTLSEPRRSLAVLTTGRQDYGILRSTLHLLQQNDTLEQQVWVGGMHLNERFGHTIDLIRADGIAVSREIPFVSEPPDASLDAARALAAVAQALRAERPHALLLVGDRTETLAAGLAATIERVPIVHMHGGEETEGAIDNACRHALTKLSHFHLVSNARHADRVLGMGEDAARVAVVGPAGVDNLYRSDLLSCEELQRQLGLQLQAPVVVVTVHPATLAADVLADVTAVAAAMAAIDATYVVTLPNADQGGAAIREYWERWSADRKNVRLVAALGERAYWSLLRMADAVLGNSSSGIIEAPAASVAVVNVGDRQKGRVRFGYVQDVPADAAAVTRALRAALRNPRPQVEPAYPSGPAAPRIVRALERWLATDANPEAFINHPLVTL